MNASAEPHRTAWRELLVGIAGEVLSASEPETRIGPRDQIFETHTEPLPFLSSCAHRASGVWWPKTTSDLWLFTQEDPAGYADGMNVYRYVVNNPIILRDPSGMRSCKNDIPRDLARFKRQYDSWFDANVRVWGPFESFYLTCTFDPNGGGPGGGCGNRSVGLLGALRPDTECCRAALDEQHKVFGAALHTRVKIECKDCTENESYHTVETFDPWWRPFDPKEPPGIPWF